MHDYLCPACGFTSAGHATEELRDARAAQHEAEHETGVAMPELAEFEGGAA